MSRVPACLSVDIPVPPSKFPTWRHPLPPICLLLTSSVPSFPQHTSCPSVRPHPFSPAHSSLSNSSPNISGTGLRWTEGWIVPAKKVHTHGQGTQTLPRTSGMLKSRWKGKKGTGEGGKMWMKVDTSSGSGYHTVSRSQRTKESWLQWLYKENESGIEDGDREREKCLSFFTRSTMLKLFRTHKTGFKNHFTVLTPTYIMKRKTWIHATH